MPVAINQSSHSAYRYAVRSITPSDNSLRGLVCPFCVIFSSFFHTVLNSVKPKFVRDGAHTVPFCNILHAKKKRTRTKNGSLFLFPLLLISVLELYEVCAATKLFPAQIKKVCFQRKHTEKVPLRLQTNRILHKRLKRQRKHFLPKYFLLGEQLFD